MKTTMITYRPGEPQHSCQVELPEQPDYQIIKALVTPLLDGAELEHVSVLYRDQRADMFVDEMGHQKGLPRNDPATVIYRTNWLTRYPYTDPESLPWIAGPAIVFTRRIWF
jgi:hypothetical protein